MKEWQLNCTLQVDEEINCSESFRHCHSQIPFCNELGLGQQTFFYKGAESKYFWFCWPYGIFCKTQLCRSGDRAAIDNVKIDLQNQVEGWIWAPGSRLLTLRIEHREYISFGANAIKWGVMQHGAGEIAVIKPWNQTDLSFRLNSAYPEHVAGVVGWMFVSPSHTLYKKFACYSPISQCDGIWRWALLEITRLRWSHEGGAPWWVKTSLEEEEERPELAFFLSTLWGCGKKGDICKPGKGSIVGTRSDLQAPWAWTSQPPEL